MLCETHGYLTIPGIAKYSPAAETGREDAPPRVRQANAHQTASNRRGEEGEGEGVGAEAWRQRVRKWGARVRRRAAACGVPASDGAGAVSQPHM